MALGIGGKREVFSESGRRMCTYMQRHLDWIGHIQSGLVVEVELLRVGYETE